MKQEIIERWISDAYGIAKTHGFHDEKQSDAHFLMLIVTEISEAVEADRKGVKPRDMTIFEKACREYAGNQDWEHFGFARAFEQHVKDCFEDELADIIIRCCDFLGRANISFAVSLSQKHWESPFHHQYTRFTEEAWLWVQILNQDEYSSVGNVAGLLLTVCDYCDINDIDIAQHVEWKMKYNKTRPKRHGKRY